MNDEAANGDLEDGEELDLSTLPDDELVKQMHDDLYDGLKDEIDEGTRILLGRGWEAKRVLDEALVEGMRIVGIDFRDGILFVPEVLLAANAMKGGMEILRPLLAETGAETIGKVVIGTVKGDIHDIGKNLVSMMLEGAGFEVINIGINNDVDAYLAALEEHKPDILGMSALLTTTMPYMKVVIDTLKEKGLRDDYIVLALDEVDCGWLEPTIADDTTPWPPLQSFWVIHDNPADVATTKIEDTYYVGDALWPEDFPVRSGQDPLGFLPFTGFQQSLLAIDDLRRPTDQAIQADFGSPIDATVHLDAEPDCTITATYCRRIDGGACDDLEPLSGIYLELGAFFNVLDVRFE